MSQILEFWKGLSGAVLPFAGANAPTGWLMCNGSGSAHKITQPTIVLNHIIKI